MILFEKTKNYEWFAKNDTLTTNGVSKLFISLICLTSFHSFAAEMGATVDTYLDGMLMPFFFKNCWTPSRHSGESSLSPKLPKSSDTIRSAFSGAFQNLISESIIVTFSHPSLIFLLRSLKNVSNLRICANRYANETKGYVITALGFFSTA